MGKWIKYGGYYPTWLLRLWRKGRGKYEAREMDEHVILSGEARYAKHDIIEEDKKNLDYWIEKHNRYARREAETICRKGGETLPPSLGGTQAQRKRWMKENIYNHLPLFVRPFMYFCYRYVIRGGFLDGKEGMVFHILQGFWYRFLVDVRVFEIQRRKRK